VKKETMNSKRLHCIFFGMSAVLYLALLAIIHFLL